VNPPTSSSTIFSDSFEVPASKPSTASVFPLSSRPTRLSQLRTIVRWFTLPISISALLGMLPALVHLSSLPEQPPYVKIALLIGLLELAYAIWLSIAPDCASLWVLMIVLTGSTAMYAAAMAIVLVSSPDEGMPLGLDAVERHQVLVWCAGKVILSLSLAMICGRSSIRWHHFSEDIRISPGKLLLGRGEPPFHNR